MPHLDPHTPRFLKRKAHVDFVRETAGWNPPEIVAKRDHERFKRTQRQELVPREVHLARRLGMHPMDHILVTAGYYGDWAAALARTAKVTYTDIGKKMTRFAKESAKDRGVPAARYKGIAAELVPQRPNKYHWTFSFEPYPLAREGGLQHMLVRSLLNRRGAKLLFGQNLDSQVFWGTSHPHTAGYIKANYANPLEKLYGATTTLESITLMTETATETTPTGKAMALITVHTNPTARVRAWLDLRIARMLEKNASLTPETLAARFKTTVKEVRASLERIQQLDRIQETRKKGWHLKK